MINTENPAVDVWDKILSRAEILLVPIVVFFTPIAGILLTVMAFIFLDTLTGIWKAIKVESAFSSRGLGAIGAKLLIYESVVLCSYLVDSFILGEFLQGLFGIEFMATKIAALIFLAVEAISIDENFKAIFGVGMWSALKKLMGKAKELRGDIKDITKP